MIPRQNELNTDYYSRYIRWKEGNRSPQMQQPRQESEQEKAYDEEPFKKKWRNEESSSSATSSSRTISVEDVTGPDRRRKTSKKKEKIDEVLKSVQYLTTEMIQMKSQLSSL